MDLLQLEHFLAVVEERTFTRAAERVSRTQSAVSQSIKKLEGEVGLPLFARDVHEMPLTEAGKLLAEYARRMVRDRDQAMRQIGALRDLKLGMVTIAAQEYAGVYLLRDPLQMYLARFPDIKIAIHRSRLAQIPRQVLNRQVQVGFVEDEPAFHELKAVEFHSDQMVLIASPRHPLAANPHARLRDLDGEPFVLRRPCGAAEQTVMRLFAAHRVRRRVVAELSSFENVKNFVEAELGLAVVPRLTVRQELRDRVLVSIPVRELNVIRRRTLMIYRDQGSLSDSARELIKIVRGFKWEAAARCA